MLSFGFKEKSEIMKMKVLLAALVAAAAIVSAYALVSYSYLFWPQGTANCARDDAACAAGLDARMENCIPSSTIIEGRDGIVLMVNITRVGDACVRTEEVIASGQENSYLLGLNVTCDYNLSQISNASETACPGSLYDYAVPGEGGGGGAIPGIFSIPKINCGIVDQACKDMASDWFQGCVTSEITNTQLKWMPEGYWTMFTKINRQPDVCQVYFEVLNAVNLPPGTPSTLIGSSMSCSIPLSSFPVENLTVTWCTGDLYTYLYA